MRLGMKIGAAASVVVVSALVAMPFWLGLRAQRGYEHYMTQASFPSEFALREGGY